MRAPGRATRVDDAGRLPLVGAAEQAPARAASSDGSASDPITQTSNAVPGEPLPDKDGVVRVWLQSSTANVQLLRTHLASVGSTSTRIGVSDVVCRAPCGKVVDGSLGEAFTFGIEEQPRTDTFQLLGHKGDVIVQVTPGDPERQIWGRILVIVGSGTALGGAFSLIAIPDSGSGAQTFGTGALIGGSIALIGGYLLYRAGASDIAWSPGRPPEGTQAR